MYPLHTGKAGITKKRGYLCVTAVFFAGLLMLCSKVAVSSLIAFLFGNVLKGWIFEQWERVLFEIGFYLLMFLPSSLFLLLFLKCSPVEMYREKPNVPYLPFLYIPLVLGLLYALNLIVNLTFGGIFEPFEPVPEATDYPTEPLAIFLEFLYTALLPAIFEEWLFRGIALRKLLPYGKGLAVVASSLFFGFMHSTPSQTIFATAFGLIAGYTYLQTGSLWFGMLIHFVNNCISLGVTYWSIVFEEVSESVTLFYGVYVLLAIIFAAITIGFYISGARKRRKNLLDSSSGFFTRKQSVKSILLNPMFYLMIVGYIALIWLDYAGGAA